MLDRIRIDAADKDLLYEVAEWIAYLGSKDDPLLHECAKRICEYLAQEKLEMPMRYVSYIRCAFPSFCVAHPDKKEGAMALRHRLSAIINV